MKIHRVCFCLCTVILAGSAFAVQAIQPGDRQLVPSKTPSQDETCWMLGIRLSEASTLAATRQPWSVIEAKLDSTTTLARTIGVQLPPFPIPTGDALTDSRALIKYGLSASRMVIANSIQLEASARPLALYDVALRSGLLLAVYTPQGQETVSFVNFVENNAAIAGIPEKIWRPFVSDVRSARSYDEVRDLVVALHGLVQIYVATGSVGTPSSDPQVEEALWSLGSVWGAAVVRGRGAEFGKSWQTVEAMAGAVGIEPLPPPADATPSERLLYLIDQRNKVEEYIIDRYGKSQAALFGLAMTLPMAELQYSPGGELARTVIRFIRETASVAGVPEVLFQPVIQKLEAAAPLYDVESARTQVVIDVGDYLVRNRSRASKTPRNTGDRLPSAVVAWQMGENYGAACLQYFTGSKMEEAPVLWQQAREL